MKRLQAVADRVEPLRKFLSTRNAVGWLSCSKSDWAIHYVPTFNHWEYIRNNPNEFPAGIADKIEQMLDYLDEAAEEHISSIPEDEHPEWHVYECWASDYKYDFYKDLQAELANEGVFRIGRVSDDILVVNMPADKLLSDKTWLHTITDISKQLNMIVKFERTRI